MVRTKASRNKQPFEMRSGNSPLPLFGKFGQTLKRGFNNLIGKGEGASGPGSQMPGFIGKLMQGGAGGGKFAAIHDRLHGEGEGDVSADMDPDLTPTPIAKNTRYKKY